MITGTGKSIHLVVKNRISISLIIQHRLSKCFQPPILPDVLYEGDTSNYNHSVTVSKTGIISHVMLLLACQLLPLILADLVRMLV